MSSATLRSERVPASGPVPSFARIWVLIAMGTVILDNIEIPPYSLVVGVPGKIRGEVQSNGMHPGENDWVKTIANAPQTKSERDQLLGILETVRHLVEEQHAGPCDETKCWICSESHLERMKWYNDVYIEKTERYKRQGNLESERIDQPVLVIAGRPEE